MEADRSEADIGVAVDAEFEAQKEEKPKQPRKRFVGRRAAAETKGDSTGAIEESGAVQGLYRRQRSFQGVVTK